MQTLTIEVIDEDNVHHVTSIEVPNTTSPPVAILMARGVLYESDWTQVNHIIKLGGYQIFDSQDVAQGASINKSISRRCACTS